MKKHEYINVISENALEMAKTIYDSGIKLEINISPERNNVVVEITEKVKKLKFKKNMLTEQ